jgi:ammonia channel protein AmtB
MSTQLAACFGALTGLLCYLLFKKFADEEKSATQAICDGAITGLVAITPGAGYVSSLLPNESLRLANKIS